MRCHTLENPFERIEDRYTFDQSEFGRVLAVVSATVFLLSLASLMQTRSGLSNITEMRQDFEQLDAVVNNQRFNQSLSAIESLEGTTGGEKFQYAVQTFRGMQHGIEEAEDSQNKLQSLQSLYRWLTLISILGVTGGVTLIFI